MQIRWNPRVLNNRLWQSGRSLALMSAPAAPPVQTAVETFIQEKLTELHSRFPFTRNIKPGQKNFGAQKRVAGFTRSLYTALEFIRILKEKPRLTTTGLAKKSRLCWSLYGPNIDFKIFIGIDEARFAAGVRHSPDIQQRIIRRIEVYAAAIESSRSIQPENRPVVPEQAVPEQAAPRVLEPGQTKQLNQAIDLALSMIKKDSRATRVDWERMINALCQVRDFQLPEETRQAVTNGLAYAAHQLEQKIQASQELARELARNNLGQIPRKLKF